MTCSCGKRVTFTLNVDLCDECNEDYELGIQLIRLLKKPGMIEIIKTDDSVVIVSGNSHTYAASNVAGVIKQIGHNITNHPIGG